MFHSGSPLHVNDHADKVDHFYFLLQTFKHLRQIDHASMCQTDQSYQSSAQSISTVHTRHRHSQWPLLPYQAPYSRPIQRYLSRPCYKTRECATLQTDESSLTWKFSYVEGDVIEIHVRPKRNKYLVLKKLAIIKSPCFATSLKDC